MRFARRCKIDKPETLTMSKIFDALRFCRIQQDEARKNAVPDRDEMMTENLARANAKNDSKKAAGIRHIMNTENNKQDWNILNHVVNDPRSPHSHIYWENQGWE